MQTSLCDEREGTRELRSTRISRRHLLAASVLAPATLLLPEQAFAGIASGLKPEEAARLTREGSVERRFQLNIQQRPYLAALSYCRINRPAEQVFATLSKPEELKRALPVTRDAKYFKDSTRLRVEHGSFLVHGGYTLFWQPDAAEQTIRFWLDPSQPRDVDDVLGYFRVQPHVDGSSLLTVGIAVDTGKSILASTFRGRIHDYMSRPARYIARYVHKQPTMTLASRVD
jgi:hypothetical protein